MVQAIRWKILVVEYKCEDCSLPHTLPFCHFTLAASVTHEQFDKTMLKMVLKHRADVDRH